MMGAMAPPFLAFIFNIGPFEVLVLGAVSVMLFGGDLPDVARKAGAMVGRLRAMAMDLRRQLDEADQVREVKKLARDVKADVAELERSAEEAREMLAPPRQHSADEDELERRRRIFHEEPQGPPQLDDEDDDDEPDGDDDDLDEDDVAR